MSGDGDALLRAVLDDPGDDLPRLALADWLDERGEDDRAEFIRCQVELARIGHQPGSCKARSCPCRRLSRRARKLSLAGGVPCNAMAWAGEPLSTLPGARYWFSRGLVGRVALTTSNFRRHACAIFSRHPVVEVSLSGRMPLRREGLHWWVAARCGVTCAGDYAAVPLAIFRLLEPAELYFGYVGEDPRQGGYEDADDALADLSRACVAWGRKLAGLPALGA